MTAGEAAVLVTELKNGKRFVTRFQEEEWGISYEGHGRFQKWAHRLEPFAGGKDEWSHEELSEAQVVDLFVKNYSFETIKARLR